MMRVLAFDTSTEAIAIGLAELGERGRSRLLGSADFLAPRAAMSRLLPAVQGLLIAEGVDFGEVDAFAVGLGPGSFTGVRIAVATAKGLALGAGVPLHGIGTLDAVAWGLYADGERGLLGVLGDAMRGEVYPALFDLDETGVRRITADTVRKPEDVASEWAARSEPLLLAGNGLHKYASLFEQALGAGARLAAVEAWAPSGRGLVLALADALDGDRAGSGEPGALLPVYTRLSDAEEAEKARSGGSGALPQNGVAGPDVDA